MNLLLYKKVTLETKLSGGEVIKKLIENTETGNYMRSGTAHKYFHGIINNESFLISKIIMRKNVFIPLVKGKLLEKDKKTQLDLTASPNLFILGFITLLFIFMIAIFVIPVIKYSLNPNIEANLIQNFPYKTLSVILAFYFFFITMGTITFNTELKKTLSFLDKILN